MKLDYYLGALQKGDFSNYIPFATILFEWVLAWDCVMWEVFYPIMEPS